MDYNTDNERRSMVQKKEEEQAFVCEINCERILIALPLL